MRPTNRFFAVVIFLLAIFMCASTPATAQIFSEKAPIIIAPERRSTGEILLRVVVVGAPCTGQYVVYSNLSGRPIDLSNMKLGEVRMVSTGWFSRPGEFSLSFQEAESVGTAACPYWKGGRLDTVYLSFNAEGKLENPRRLPGMYVGDDGKTTVRLVDQGQRPADLRFLFRLPAGGQTQLYFFQTFPNNTTSVVEDMVAAPSPAGFGFTVISFEMTQMTPNLPVYFVAIRDGVSTSGVVYTP